MKNALLRCAALLTVFAHAAPATADPPPPVVIEVSSLFPTGMSIVGQGAVRLAKKVERASGGELRIILREPGQTVAAADTAAALEDGRIEAAWAGAGWFASKDAAFDMFSSVPFGPGLSEYLGWIYQGGGLELSREMFHDRGIHNIPCTVIPPEASGWFRKEIQYIDDFKGLRMRFFGLGAKVMAKIGARPRQIPPGDVLEEMERGNLDAAEFSLPLMDEPFGFDRIAKYYYFPGWHQPATFFDLYVRKDRWDALPDRLKAVLEHACGDTMRETIAEAEAAQGQALEELRRRGVQFRRWSPEILVALEEAWNEVVAEESLRSKAFRKVHDSLERYRAKVLVWRDLSSM